MRNPVVYGLDVVGGVRAVGVRGMGRLLAANLLLSTGIGATVTAVGAGGVEAASMVAPTAVSLGSVTTPEAGELVGVALGLSAAAGLVQGVHHISKEGQAVRAARRAAHPAA